MNMKKRDGIIDELMEEASRLIGQGYYEEAVLTLQKCLRLIDEPERRAAIFDKLGYCFLRLGWYEDAVKIYTRYLDIYPHDND